MTARDLKEVTATGDVIAGPVILRSAALSSGALAGSTVEVRDGSASAIRLTLAAVTEGASGWRAGAGGGVLFSSALHATLSGTGATASFEYS